MLSDKLSYSKRMVCQHGFWPVVLDEKLNVAAIKSLKCITFFFKFVFNSIKQCKYLMSFKSVIKVPYR